MIYIVFKSALQMFHGFQNICSIRSARENMTSSSHPFNSSVKDREQDLPLAQYLPGHPVIKKKTGKQQLSADSAIVHAPQQEACKRTLGLCDRQSKKLVLCRGRKQHKGHRSLKPVQDVDCVNGLIGHNWIHVTVGEAGMSSSGNARDTWEKFRLEGPFLQMISKVSFANIIATCVTRYESVYLEAHTVDFPKN